jgi:hypothetical protein
MANYYFEEIENGQIREEYSVIDINDHVAEIDNDDEAAMLLAEKNGGVIEAPPILKAAILAETPGSLGAVEDKPEPPPFTRARRD